MVELMCSSMFTPRTCSSHGEFQIAEDFNEVWLNKEAFEVRAADTSKEVI